MQPCVMAVPIESPESFGNENGDSPSDYESNEQYQRLALLAARRADSLAGLPCLKYRGVLWLASARKQD